VLVILIKVHVDGAARPNPGYGGVGIVIEGDNWDYRISKSLKGTISGNLAECRALVYALQELSNNGCFDNAIRIFSDSQRVVGHVNGIEPIHGQEDYYQDYLNACQLMERFSDLVITWIPRTQNAQANLLASKGAIKASKFKNDRRA